ncbi:hypothetical protein Esi_0176_0027 [Ectocarpus siliculosus]|uniref:Uncharacterized protein n=1 Tax=Ectocarpus siliculosus TaxID=2880 RepID=D8LGR1_ECTSI|nr:hypothetical protein Esi_0176_0027 [Ectocarpus siliculosus]|eukprot:CBN79081.1 hypothetical protein Esi_0176_0027 [Ectocarpus siliculosus]
MPVVLSSRWGIEPVTVGTACTDDGPLPLPFETSTTTAAGEAATQQDYCCDDRAIGEDGDEEDMELTGRTLWDCTQVLWDLVADPREGNTFTVRDKRVIELGGGTGALSVGLARSEAASVTCTDLPCHLALIQSTVVANARTTASCRRGVLGSDVGGGGGGGCGGGSGGGNCGGVVAGTSRGSDPPAATEVPAAAAREARVRVVALRWGEEEDIANARALPFNNHSGERRRCSSSSGGGGASDDESSAFDVIVLSEVLYWPALDLLQEDTREPLRRTLVGLSKPGTKVILIYKERWPEREAEFLRTCEASFEVGDIPADLLALPTASTEDPGSAAIRAVVMVRLPLQRDEQ